LISVRLKDRVAIVTGAASGIGFATALRFAAEGARVVAADLVENSQLAEAVGSAAGTISSIPTDVSKADSVANLFSSTLERHGRLDVLVNCAGIELARTATDTIEDDWDRLMNVNLKGVFLCAKAAVPAMRPQGGVIINVASELGLVAAPELAAYCASKGGVIQLTKAMAIDHAAENIRVNCVCPGPINTPLLDRIIATAADPNRERRETVEKVLLKRLGEPREIANVILFLASSESSFMTGAIVVADGGLTAQ
jgi:NAD(P)-dependent dehydrogenase (short-subunit alcohol dehydrogenase family)